MGAKVKERGVGAEVERNGWRLPKPLPEGRASFSRCTRRAAGTSITDVVCDKEGRSERKLGGWERDVEGSQSKRDEKVARKVIKRG
jgi:hypothetical protein